MAEKERVPMSEEEINQAIEQNEKEPFDPATEQGKVEQYYNSKKGEILQAQREISEMFGLDDAEVANANRMIKDYHEKMNQDFSAEEMAVMKDFGRKEYFQSFDALYYADAKISKNKNTAESVLNAREKNERRKKIQTLNQKIAKI